MFKDLREYIEKLQAEGELKVVDCEVDWNLEIGAITRRCLDLKTAAPLFVKINDYPGYRVLGCPLGPTKPLHGRFAIAIGLPRDTPTMQLIDEFAKRLERQPIKPRIVSKGPCKENIQKGDKINLLKLPVPLIHGTDRERYIGTWHIDVTKDPDTGAVNWGMYRHAIHDEKTLGVHITGAHHGMIHYRKYEERNEDMPIAIAIGTEPVSSMVAGFGLINPPEECEYAGAIRGKPVELVKCETLDLYVPAHSEIVIEGIMKPKERMPEGPFGEFTGYNAGGRMPRPVIHVTCVTYRNDPILTMSNMGKPYDESHILWSVGQSAVISNDLKNRGLAFKSVYVHPPLMAIVSAKEIYGGYSHVLASAIRSIPNAVNIPYIVVVGEDVDVTNAEDVLWCLATRMHPSKGTIVESGVPGNPLFPFLGPDERKVEETITGHRMLFIATFPAYWPPEEVPQIIDFESAWPTEVKEKVLKRWKEYKLE